MTGRMYHCLGEQIEQIGEYVLRVNVWTKKDSEARGFCGAVVNKYM